MDKRKLMIKKYICLLGITITVVCLCVWLGNLIEHRPVKKTPQIESKLPYGVYLPTAENPRIRVVIKTEGFHHIAHAQVQLRALSGMTICYGDKTEKFAKQTEITFAPDDIRFQSGRIRIAPNRETDQIDIPSLTRGKGTASYRGILDLYTTAEGIVIINELPVEEYLYAVVPSEMPASYEIEALKCQAVCARSYAYCQMLSFAYPVYEAHVDDSVAFQVYGNSKEHERTTKAVNETFGQKAWYKGQVVKTYYYSTSCGHSTSIEAWGSSLTKENAYLKGVSLCDKEGNAYEKNLPWFRWKATIPSKELEYVLEQNLGKELGVLQKVEITKVGVGGVVLELKACGTEGEFVVRTENKIRKALAGSAFFIEKQDGSKVKIGELLPSAFFLIAKNGENYIIEGGGYGHGIGMSQNGANEMAKAGKTYEEILTFFYPGTKVE